MIAVIIAGGSGTRLWPLSTHNYPKQLLKLTGEASMVQATYERAKKFADKIYVVPDISHAHLIAEQLSEISDEFMIVEPGRRGTANCIVAALAHIAKRHDQDEPIAFMSTDHHIRDLEGFAHSFKLAAEVSQSRKFITLIGVEPTYPSTGYGYIERDGKDEESEGGYFVESFKEKPDYETAKKYVSSGKYLWNCGYFVGSLETFLSEMTNSAPNLKQNFDRLKAIEDPKSDEYKQTYLSFESDSIDYALIEKASRLLVVPASFDWMDLGSFKDLHEANESDEQGNHCHGENIFVDEIANTYIRNEENKPVAVVGLDNVVVVNTKDGVLVVRRDLSQKVGDIAKEIQTI